MKSCKEIFLILLEVAEEEDEEENAQIPIRSNSASGGQRISDNLVKPLMVDRKASTTSSTDNCPVELKSNKENTNRILSS